MLLTREHYECLEDKMIDIGMIADDDTERLVRGFSQSFADGFLFRGKEEIETDEDDYSAIAVKALIKYVEEAMDNNLSDYESNLFFELLKEITIFYKNEIFYFEKVAGTC